jgi:hypothetical protein
MILYPFVNKNSTLKIGERIPLNLHSFTLKNRRKSTTSLIVIYSEDYKEVYSFVDAKLP